MKALIYAIIPYSILNSPGQPPGRQRALITLQTLNFWRGNFSHHRYVTITKHGGVSKNRGKTPKMDGENNGSKPYEEMDDLGVPVYLGIPAA